MLIIIIIVLIIIIVKNLNAHDKKDPYTLELAEHKIEHTEYFSKEGCPLLNGHMNYHRIHDFDDQLKGHMMT